MQNLLALLSGLLFGIGLIISEMINPAKVLGFLDLAGAWDPSLALVMIGALLVGIPTFAWAKRLPNSLCGNAIQIPQRQHIDRRLVLGGLSFGMGWGLVGLCPGPALVAAVTLNSSVLLFVATMLISFFAFGWLEQRRTT
jgi:uncharacterized membrane protein YedE/YeeE